MKKKCCSAMDENSSLDEEQGDLPGSLNYLTDEEIRSLWQDEKFPVSYFYIQTNFT